MSDFLSRLAARSLGAPSTISPDLPPRFAPVVEAPPSAWDVPSSSAAVLAEGAAVPEASASARGPRRSTFVRAGDGSPDPGAVEPPDSGGGVFSREDPRVEASSPSLSPSVPPAVRSERRPEAVPLLGVDRHVVASEGLADDGVSVAAPTATVVDRRAPRMPLSAPAAHVVTGRTSPLPRVVEAPAEASPVASVDTAPRDVEHVPRAAEGGALHEDLHDGEAPLRPASPSPRWEAQPRQVVARRSDGGAAAALSTERHDVAAEGDEGPVIRVSIGRIEVRAAGARPAPTPRPRAAEAPRSTLDDYLRQRARGPSR